MSKQKKILYTLLVGLCLIFPSRELRAQSSGDRPKVAIVLAGGGAKGFAHIGALKVLKEADVPFDIIVGNSMGSVVGSLLAAGYEPEVIERISKEQDWNELLSDEVPRIYESPVRQEWDRRYLVELPILKGEEKDQKKGPARVTVPVGVVRGQNILNTFSRYFIAIDDSIDFQKDLPIPLTVIATNLETGKEERLTHGNLPKAVLSSMCVPGVFHPVDFHGKYLVDGGVINNFPADVAEAQGADIIIGIDLRADFKEKDDLISLGDVFGQLLDIIDYDRNINNQALCDVLIIPDLEGYTAASFTSSAVDTLILRGERAAREALPKIEEIVERYNLKYSTPSREYTDHNYWVISEINLDDKYLDYETLILDRMHLTLGEAYTSDEIKQAIRRLYGYGNFELVDYNLIENEAGHTIDLHIIDKNSSFIRFGFSVNTTDAATVNLNYSYENYRTFINLISLDIKGSANPRVIYTMETQRLKFLTAGMRVNGFYSSLDGYAGEDVKANSDIIGTGITTYFYKRLGRSFDIGSGVKNSYVHSTVLTNGAILSGLGGDSTFRAPFTGGESRFYSTLYFYTHYSNFENSNTPGKGISLNVNLSAYSTYGSLSDLIPVASLKFFSAMPISKRISLLSETYYRGIFNDGIPVNEGNYTAIPYNAFSGSAFNLAGQPGFRLLNRYALMFSPSIRYKLNDSNFITLKGQALAHHLKFDFAGNQMVYAGELNYTVVTKLGPISANLGLNSLDEGLRFYGAIGYTF